MRPSSVVLGLSWEHRGPYCQARGFPLLRWGKPYCLDPPPRFAVEAAEQQSGQGFSPATAGKPYCLGPLAIKPARC